MRTLKINGVTFSVPKYVSRKHSEKGWRLTIAGVDVCFADANSSMQEAFHSICKTLLDLKDQEEVTLRDTCPVKFRHNGLEWICEVPTGFSNDKIRCVRSIRPIGRVSKDLTPMKITNPFSLNFFVKEDIEDIFDLWKTKLRFSLSVIDRQDIIEAMQHFKPQQVERVVQETLF